MRLLNLSYYYLMIQLIESVLPINILRPVHVESKFIVMKDVVESSNNDFLIVNLASLMYMLTFWT
jgi:hypothetical protein